MSDRPTPMTDDAVEIIYDHHEEAWRYLVPADVARRLERQRDAYAETLRQTLVLLDSVPTVEQPALLDNIIRERHPELGNDQAETRSQRLP